MLKINEKKENKKKENKTKKKFTLFSDHDRSFPRRQPGANIHEARRLK
jgi:hypothetical protein